MQTSSENTDLKMNTLDEPAAHLIEDNVALPEDMFSSYLGYLFYELAHFPPFILMLLVTTSLVSLLVFFHDSYRSTFFYVFSSLVSGFLLQGTLIVFCDESVRDHEFDTKLLVEVITRKPAVKGKEWRTITYKMNQYLFDRGHWFTPYFFYCDEKCYRYFLRLIEGVTPKRQETTSTDNAEEDIQSNIPATTASDVSTGPVTSSSVPVLQKLLFRAAEIEQQSQENYWRDRYPDIDALL
ncbi:hypothetical protein SMKI_01G0820 [Saccharomyces mikatae IFO 1815]|uniref:YCR007C-like protein n=1 Tax=Saccharomyces mikatae IFO 1815 TaxID=226126 RepID=A0AA35IUE9_SACMI|nr:uncharacterized protein SMKI_01G0820 [Saccharomyces mikatae IFO 1815]CAI4037123.1 hypothetical protein SMKI_01G0820 [Saccharomyces mikatae IFO 1815]